MKNIGIDTTNCSWENMEESTIRHTNRLNLYLGCMIIPEHSIHRGHASAVTYVIV